MATSQDVLDQEVENLFAGVKRQEGNAGSGHFKIAFWLAVRALVQQRPDKAERILTTAESWKYLRLPSTEQERDLVIVLWEVVKRERFQLQHEPAAEPELSVDEQRVLAIVEESRGLWSAVDMSNAANARAFFGASQAKEALDSLARRGLINRKREGSLILYGNLAP